MANGNDVKENQKRILQLLVGYLAEHNPLYLDLYVREYLALMLCINLRNLELK
jgi:ABC-2 type transport system ATP-binding protein